MANPQIEDGHIVLANEIVEQFCKHRISGEEWLVLWSIIRKTYGWKKKEDRIALSQFAVMTGLKRQHIVRAIRKLHSKKIIAVIKNDDSGINIYSFNKNFDQWSPLSKKITTFIPESSLKKYCYICGFEDAIEEHHITLRSNGGSDKVENKIILCPNCHTLVHKGRYNEQFLRTKKDNVENIIKKDNPIDNMDASKKIHTKETITKETITKEREQVILPEKIKPETWSAYLEMRKVIKKPATKHAQILIIKKLLTMSGDPNLILEQSIRNSYQGVFPLKEESNAGTTTNFRDPKRAAVYVEQDRLADDINEKWRREKALEAANNPPGNT